MTVTKKELDEIVKISIETIDNTNFDYPDVKHHIADNEDSRYSFQQCVLIMLGHYKDGINLKNHFIKKLKKEYKKDIVGQFTTDMFEIADFDKRVKTIKHNLKETMYDRYVRFVFSAHEKLGKELKTQGVHTLILDTSHDKASI